MKMFEKFRLVLSKFKFRWIALVTILMLGLGACHWHHNNADSHHAKMIKKGMSVVSYKLDFDQQQEALLSELTAEIMLIRAETKTMHQDREAAFAQLLNAKVLDTEKIESLIGQHREQFDLFMPRILPQLEKLHATLTEEQKAKIEKGLAKRFRKHHSA